MIVNLHKDLGYKSDANIMNNICFVHSVAQCLFTLPRESYAIPLQYTAVYHNLNLCEREDYEKSLSLLIDSIYNN
jgi:hypothetical protein